MRGYFAIGIDHGKTAANQGSLWRSAANFGAAFVFTLGQRFTDMPSDTTKTFRRCPMFTFASIDDLVEHLPFSCPLIAIEGAPVTPTDFLPTFEHPERAVYLLGSEDGGLPQKTLARCHRVVALPGGCLNVAVAGGIVMYDRTQKHLIRAVDAPRAPATIPPVMLHVAKPLEQQQPL